MYSLGVSESEERLAPKNLEIEDGVAQEWKPGKQEFLIIFTMVVLSVVVSLDATILVPALPTLARELNGTALETFWTGTSYLLSSAVFPPFIGQASEIFGRKTAVLFALVMFTAGTIVCCVANNMTVLLSGRTIQGIGGGGIFVMSSIVISDIIPLRQRPKFQGLVAAAWGLGAILGPLCGGLFAENTSWRWLFYINFPFFAIGFACIPFFKLRLIRQESLSRNIGRVDWLGNALFIAGITSFLIGLTWGGVQYEWSSWKTWMPIVIGIVVVTASIVYEALVPSEPFLRLGVFRNLSAVITFLLTMTQGMIMYGTLYYLPFYFVSVKERGPAITGVFIMAVNIILFPASVMAGIFMTKWGTYAWSVQTGFAVLALGDGLLLYLDQHKNLASHLCIFLVSGVGLGFVLPSLEAAAQAIAKPKDIAHAISTYIFMRLFGLCIGVASGGAVFLNVFLQALKDKDIPNAGEIAHNAEAIADTLRQVPDTPEKALLIDCYVEGFHGVFYLLMGLAIFSAVASIFIKNFDMDQQLNSTHQVRREQPKRQSLA